MAMAMLKAGGVPFVDGSHPDSGELTHLGPDTLAAVRQGGAVKLLDWVLRVDLSSADWRFIWLDRDPHEQARSTAKFIAGFGFGDEIDVGVLAASYGRDRPVALGRLRALGPVLVLGYERVLAQPKKAARQIGRFVAGVDGLGATRPTELWFDVKAAAAVVHQRDGRCRPDLAIEAGRAQGTTP
jgi:hypothetical protein